MYVVGTNIRVTRVEKRTPKPKETAIGTKNFAWILLSNIKGRTPMKVVIEVRRIVRCRTIIKK